MWGGGAEGGKHIQCPPPWTQARTMAWSRWPRHCFHLAAVPWLLLTMVAGTSWCWTALYQGMSSSPRCLRAWWLPQQRHQLLSAVPWQTRGALGKTIHTCHATPCHVQGNTQEEGGRTTGGTCNTSDTKLDSVHWTQVTLRPVPSGPNPAPTRCPCTLNSLVLPLTLW